MHIFCYGSEAHWQSMGSFIYEHQSSKHLGFKMIKISHAKHIDTGVTGDVMLKVLIWYVYIAPFQRSELTVIALCYESRLILC